MSLQLDKVNLTRSPLYNKVSNASCNLLTAILRVKSRMAVSVGVVSPPNYVADWELRLPAAAPSSGAYHTAYR